MTNGRNILLISLIAITELCAQIKKRVAARSAATLFLGLTAIKA